MRDAWGLIPAHVTVGRVHADRVRRTEGLVGLYRGFGASVATFVPSSSIWWGSYGAYQKFIWQQLDRRRPPRGAGEAKPGSEVGYRSRPPARETLSHVVPHAFEPGHRAVLAGQFLTHKGHMP